jgi:hypothetical protein
MESFRRNRNASNWLIFGIARSEYIVLVRFFVGIDISDADDQAGDSKRSRTLIVLSLFLWLVDSVGRDEMIRISVGGYSCPEPIILNVIPNRMLNTIIVCFLRGARSSLCSAAEFVRRIFLGNDLFIKCYS